MIVIEKEKYDYILQCSVPNKRNTYETVFGFNMPFTEYQEYGYEGVVAEDGTDIYFGYEFLIYIFQRLLK